MTLLSEILQLLTIVAFPALALALLLLARHNSMSGKWLVTAAFTLSALDYYSLRSYTLFAIGVLCPQGERMVEVPPSIFSSYGDQQTCVPATLWSTIAEHLANNREWIHISLSYVTWLVCLVLIIYIVKMRRSKLKTIIATSGE